jgi:hypothetical protein
MFIRHDPGDPETLHRVYDENFTKSAGQPGRGEDWGIPLVVLHHICGYNEKGSVTIDIFEDEETMKNLVFNQERLPPHLRPAVSSAGMWEQMGLPRPKDRWERDVQVMRVEKVLPPLRAVVSDEGGLRRPRY